MGRNKNKQGANSYGDKEENPSLLGTTVTQKDDSID